MTHQTRKLLFDVLESARSIRAWRRDHSFSDSRPDPQFRRVFERKLEIRGEVLNRLLRIDRAVTARLDQLSRIIRFRNRIIHGYDTIDDASVWGIADPHRPRLLAEVESFLQQPQGELDKST